MRELERQVVLTVLDRKWREHLYEMDYLREGIGLRAMAQRDPLVEYQREGGDMFNAMMDAFMEESIGFLFNLEVNVDAPATRDPARAAWCGRRRGATPHQEASLTALRSALDHRHFGHRARGGIPVVWPGPTSPCRCSRRSLPRSGGVPGRGPPGRGLSPRRPGHAEWGAMTRNGGMLSRFQRGAGAHAPECGGPLPRDANDRRPACGR
jgi:hypothetical protein